MMIFFCRKNNLIHLQAVSQLVICASDLFSAILVLVRLKWRRSISLAPKLSIFICRSKLSSYPIYFCLIVLTLNQISSVPLRRDWNVNHSYSDIYFLLAVVRISLFTVNFALILFFRFFLITIPCEVKQTIKRISKI